MIEDMHASQRRMLWTSSITGGSSVLGLLLGIIRLKIAALTIGPAGVGLIGLYQNVVNLAVSVAGCGVGNAAPKEIAAAQSRGGEPLASKMRANILSLSLLLATISILVLLSFQNFISKQAFGSNQPNAVVWIAVATAAGILMGSLHGALTGSGRIGDAAKVTLYANIATTLIAVPIFIYAPHQAALAFVTITSVVGLVFALYYFINFDKRTILLSADTTSYKRLISLGASLTFATIALLAGQLLVRKLISDQLGDKELGLFQASWSIATVYLMVVLQAMSADFYPRLSAVITNGRGAAKLINEQTELALLLGGPIILALISTAPIVISLLFGEKFSDASEMLRWQLSADVLKIASWPLGFALLAGSRKLSYLGTEILAATLFVGTSWLLLPRMGLTGAGVAYFVMYLIYLPTVWLFVRRFTFVRWSRSVTIDFVLLLIAAIGLLLVPSPSELTWVIGGILVSGLYALRSAYRLRHLWPLILRR